MPDMGCVPGMGVLTGGVWKKGWVREPNFMGHCAWITLSSNSPEASRNIGKSSILE